MKALETYFKDRKSALTFILEKAPELYTIETFHELRVEIKRLQALLEIIAFCHKKFKPRKTLIPFKIIFKEAGKIRELQLEQTILEKQPNFHLLEKYPCRLKKLENKKIKNFFTIVNKHLMKKLRGKYLKISALLTKISKKKIIRYKNKTRIKIKKIVHKSKFKENQIHQFRKRLKVYQYNEKIGNIDLQNHWIEAGKALSGMMGEWHDYKVVILHLKKIIPYYKTKSNEKKNLINIRTSVTSKRDLLFRKINTTLSNRTLV